MMGGDTKYGTNSRAIVKQVGNAVKSTISKKSNLFEAFRFRYFGPTDGHDVIKLVRLLKDLSRIESPKLLHVITKKGKGLTMAENKPTAYHSPGLFDKKTGEIHTETSKKKLPPKYQDVFGETIVELAEKNDKILGITPAMPTGSSLNIMMEKMPNRAFDVGIAEQHAVTFSAGLATQGFIPFCNIYSTFMQRAYDQIIHDVALQNLHVIFCLDRGGLVGEDGPTHHGVFDLAYLRTIPNIIIAAPMNEEELRNMMYTAQLENTGTFSIRYPRGRGVMTEWKTAFKKIEIGKAEKIRDGKDVAIISIGHPGNSAIEACRILAEKGIDAAHYNMRFLKPIDEDMLHKVFKSHDKIITVEDGTILGGLGSTVIEFMNDNGYKASVKRMGIPDEFIPQGTPDELMKICAYDIDGIIETVYSLK
jgi:1-deoxy-D-xylulose-5-phosphate synthase